MSAAARPAEGKHLNTSNDIITHLKLITLTCLCLCCVQEQQDKAALQQQVLNLRQDNLRLQEESQSTVDQIRKFTAWMLHRRTLP